MEIGDLILEDNKVILESEPNGTLILDGAILRSKTYDFWLYHKDRLTNGVDPGTCWRRTICHTYGDGVGINVDGDYPGGVTIWGKVEIPDILKAKKINIYSSEFDDITLKGYFESLGTYLAGKPSLWMIPPKGGVSPQPDVIRQELVIHRGKIKVRFTRSSGEEVKEDITYDLLDEIFKLRDKVDALQKEIEKLKKPF